MNWLDTRNNLLSVILVAAIGAIALVGVVAALFMGRVDVSNIPPAALGSGEIALETARNPGLPEFSAFSAVLERPVFFEDRTLPVIELAEDGEGEELPAEEPAPVVELPELKAKLAGIIITPELKIAMITDNDSRETLILREGMAMAGEKSAWRISEIQPRGVRFETDSGESERLELEVETQALAAGAQPTRTAAAAAAPQEAAAAETPAESGQDTDAEAAARARAEEIRRRVAERRAQLRAEAERRAQQARDGSQ